MKAFLEVKGRAKVSLQAAQGQATETIVYVVKGHDIEPLLGLEDTVALGILTINPEGAVINRVQTVPQSPDHHHLRLVNDEAIYTLMRVCELSGLVSQMHLMKGMA